MLAGRSRLTRWGVLGGVLVAVLLRGTAPLQARPQQVDLRRAAIVQQYFTALAAGDVDGALALFAPNAEFIGSRPTGNCSAHSPCTELAGIRQQLDANLALGHHCQVATSLEVVGSTVLGRTLLRNDAIRARGIERILQTFLAQVPEDQITALYLVQDLTDPQTVTDLAILAGTQAPAPPLPTPDPPCPEVGP
jgi:hypothetical protein